MGTSTTLFCCAYLTLLIIILPHGCFSGTILNGEFLIRSSSPTRNIKLYMTHRGSKCCAECALLCLSSSTDQGHCLAFTCQSQGMLCKFYKITRSDPSLPGVGEKLYFLQVPDRFHTISVEGRLYSVFISSQKKKYLDARIACHRLGAHLLEFDSQEEYEALFTVKTRQTTENSFVGAHSLGGQWVTDNDGLPLDQDMWRWFEPPNAFECAIVKTQRKPLKSRQCDMEYTYVCERDL